MTAKQEQYSKHAIRADADFVVSTIANFATLNPSPIAVMSLTPYLALFLYESRKTLVNYHDSSLALEASIEALLTASRHSVKLFEDTHRGISGQCQVMHDEIIPSHKDYFLGNTWFPPARFLETDLGFYLLDQSPFSSTHAYTYLVGLPPEAIRNGTTSEIAYNASVAYGNAFATLSRHPSTSMPAAIRLLSNESFPKSCYKDRKSDQSYSRLFNGPDTPDLNATLTCQLTLIRFVTDGYTPLSHDEYKYTLFKIPFITAYQVTSSLKKLLSEERASLTVKSIKILEKITQSNEANIILNNSGRSIRNLLVHYTPLASANDDLIDDDLLLSTFRLAGVVESIPSYERIVTNQLDLIRNEMIEWCNWK
jgi:hypothetical protein